MSDDALRTAAQKVIDSCQYVDGTAQSFADERALDRLRAALAEPSGPRDGHPGEQHEYRATCLRCGEPGTLFVAILGPDEQATIEPR